MAKKDKNKQKGKELPPEFQRLAWKGVNIKRKQRRKQKDSKFRQTG